MLRSTPLSAALLAAALSAAAQAQEAPFRTPGSAAQGRGQAARPESGQSDRFSSAFNPAFSFVIDALADWADVEGGEDGFDLALRSLELGAQTWIDPSAWAYFLAAADEESLAVEEAAVHYTGLGGNHTLRAGRFFIDFGKQMQNHVHELRTLERPLPLRAYLGSEAAGDGLQWDCWTAAGDETVVRWSLGAFASLLGGDEHGDAGAGGPRPAAPERRRVEELAFTARASAFRDVGESGVLQLGASLRAIPDHAFEDQASGARLDGLANTVLGLDLTYGWTGEDGIRRWTFGGEALASLGDSGVALDDGGTPLDTTDDTLRALDERLFGAFVFADHAWSANSSAGLQLGLAELPTAGAPRAAEAEIHYTRLFSEWQRLRLAVTRSWLEDDVDSLRVALQYTVFAGVHAHGVNW